jgi:type II secretory pathway component PulK
MVAVVMVMVLTMLMVIMLGEFLTWVEVNHHHITKVTIPIDTNHMLLGVLVVMDPNMGIEVLEDVKES